MNAADKVETVVREVLRRSDWCAFIEEIVQVDSHSISVTWRRTDSTVGHFDISEGEIEKARTIQGFIKIIQDKCGVEAEKPLKEQMNNLYMERAKKRKMVHVQQVTSCDKCDKIMPDGMVDGTACPSCGDGKVYLYNITLPRMPMPGVKGTKERANAE